MAASRFQEASSSTSRSSYHVFVSFRGEDIQTPLIDHLCTALLDSRFRTVREDNVVVSKLQKTIKESRMSIVFLSKNYASSSWCLDELVMILKRKRTSGHVVLFIYYHEEPWDVYARKQIWSFEEAITRHERQIEVESGERRKELMSKVEEWRAALREVVDFTRRRYSGAVNGCWEEMIEKIVGIVGRRLSGTTLDIRFKQVANLPGVNFQNRTDWNRTRNGGGTSSDLISLEILQQHFGNKRKEVAKSLGISVSTFKRVCRIHGILRWPHPKRNNVSRHSDPHRQENPSPTFNTPSTNGHITMENEMGGPNSEPSECLPDSFEEPNFQNIGNAVYNETTTAGGSSQCVFQLQGHTTQSTAYPNCNALLFPQPQTASTEVLNESIGGSEYRRDLLASQAEATPRQALASVPMIPDIISHLTEGSPKTFHLENEIGGLIPEPNEFLSDSFEVPSLENTLNGFMVDIDFHDSFPGNYHNADFLFSSVHNGPEAARGSSRWEFQVQGQTTQFPAHPIPNEALASVATIPHMISHLIEGSPNTFQLENEMGGRILELNEFLQDSLEVPSFGNTPNDLLVEMDFDGSFPGNYHNADFRFSSVHNETEAAGGSSKWAFQVQGQTTQFPAHPIPNVVGFPQPQIASTEVLSENMGSSKDGIDFLASLGEAFLEGDVFESSNLMVPAACSDAAGPSRPEATILHTMPSSPQRIPHLTGRFSEWAFQSTEFPEYPNPNDLVDPHPPTASTQILSEIMGSLEDQSNLLAPHPQTASTQILSEIMGSLEDSNLLAPQEMPLTEGHVSGSVNGTVHSCSETALSQQPMATIPDAMTTLSDKTPTIHMMPHLAAKEDIRSVMLKLTYGEEKIKFPFPLMSGIIELKEQVKKRLKLDLDRFNVKYEDTDGDRILLNCDEDLRNHLHFFSNQVINLLVVNSDANTKNFR